MEYVWNVINGRNRGLTFKEGGGDVSVMIIIYVMTIGKVG